METELQLTTLDKRSFFTSLDLNSLEYNAVRTYEMSSPTTRIPPAYFPRTIKNITPANSIEGKIDGSFTITLDTPAPSDGLVVNFDTAGTATPTTDYTLSAGTNITALTANTFTIAPEATTATLNVVSVADPVSDSNETVILNLKPGDYKITNPSATVAIIEDFIAPTITLSPVDNVNGVPVDAKLVINFSEEVQKGTGNILLKKASDNSTVESINVANIAVNGRTITIKPRSNLAENTQYYLEIPSGSIKDLAGNNFAGITGSSSWNFTTYDRTISVNRITDDGTGNTPGTLSWAIQQANNNPGADTIYLNTNVRMNFADNLLRMKPLIDSDITILGNNKTISGDNNNNSQVDDGDRPIFFVRSGNVVFKDLTFTGGVARPGGGAAGMGGALFIYDGNIKIDNVAFTNNQAIGSLLREQGVKGLGLNVRDGDNGRDGFGIGNGYNFGNGGNGGFGASGGNGGNGYKFSDAGNGGNGGFGASGGNGGDGYNFGSGGNGGNGGFGAPGGNSGLNTRAGNGGNGGFGAPGGNGRANLFNPNGSKGQESYNTSKISSSGMGGLSLFEVAM